MLIARSNIDTTKDKRRNGMIYEHAFLVQCAILRMKSNAAYVHIRANMLLPLPSPSTIRRLLSSSECKFGFNDLALEQIGLALKGLIMSKRLCTLMWDEIKITKDMRFDTKTLKWKGIQDYAGQTTIMVPNGLADHVLVFVCRPLHAGWIQPFAWFGTKGGAPGAILLQLLPKAISTLWNHGAVVSACVSDGYSTNKAVLKQLDIFGTEDSKCYIEHPMEKRRKIYFFLDVPHLLKCTRNHMHKHKIVQVRIFYFYNWNLYINFYSSVKAQE